MTVGDVRSDLLRFGDGEEGRRLKSKRLKIENLVLVIEEEGEGWVWGAGGVTS